MMLKQVYYSYILYVFILLYTVVLCQIPDCRTPNNVYGICVELQNCKRLFDEVVTGNKDAFPFIRASRCDPKTDTTLPKVCCGPDISFTNTSDSDDLNEGVTQKVGSVTTTLSPPSSENTILPRTCGRQKIFLEYKIYGGKQASIGEFPWLARLVYLSKDNRTNLGCSGFLIHSKFVLTAAHCLVGEYIKYLGSVQGVILGVYNDTTGRICVEQFCTDPPRNVSALPAIIHPNYEPNTHNHDIALIPLKEKIAFTNYIRAICLPQTTTNAVDFTVSGWGRTESGFSSTAKLKVVVPRITPAFCEERYRTVGQSLTDRQLCAGGEQGYSACTGDSGGPLMAMTKDEIWYAEGIVSFGASRCGIENWPSVYTHIPKYYDWVLEQIKNTLKTYNVDR